MKIRVRYAEVDRMGAAYYANYFIWFEVGRTERLEKAGIPYKKLEEHYQVVLPVIEAYAKYRKSVGFDEEIEVTTKITDLSKRKIRFDYRILRSTGEIACSGYTTHIPVTPQGKTISFPEEIYKILEKALHEDNKTP